MNIAQKLLLCTLGLLLVGGTAGRAQGTGQWRLGISLGKKVEKALGIEIVLVAPNSPAEKAGIEETEWLWSVNGVVMTTKAGFEAAIRNSKTAEIELGVTNPDTLKHRTVKVTMEKVGSGGSATGSAPKWVLGVDLAATVGSNGLEITRVHAGSPADSAYLQKGECIVSYDGTELTDRATFLDAMRQSTTGRVVFRIYNPQSKATRSKTIQMKKSP